MENVKRRVSMLTSFSRGRRNPKTQMPETPSSNETKEAPVLSYINEPPRGKLDTIPSKDGSEIQTDTFALNEKKSTIIGSGSVSEEQKAANQDLGAHEAVQLSKLSMSSNHVRRPEDDAPDDAAMHHEAHASIAQNEQAEICFQEGTKAHANGRLEDAISQFNYAVGLDPSQPYYYHHLAHSLQESKRLDESVEAYKAMLELDASNHDGWFDMGYIQQQLGRLSEATSSYRKALVLNPQDKDALILMGTCSMTDNDFPSAIDAYKKALLIDPSCFTSHYNLGSIYLQSRDYQLAGHHFHEAILVQPDYANAYFNLAVCYQECGEYQDALDTYNHALGLQPEMREARDAIEALRQAIEQDALEQKQLQEDEHLRLQSEANIAHGKRLLQPQISSDEIETSVRRQNIDRQNILPNKNEIIAEDSRNAIEHLQRLLSSERARATKLEETMSAQAKMFADQIQVLNEVQVSNNRVEDHRTELERLKQAKASQNHATDVEIRMQKLLADFRILQGQHESLIRGKEHLHHNHDALQDAHRMEKTTVAELRDQLSRKDSDMQKLRAVSDAQQREISRLRRIESETHNLQENYAAASKSIEKLSEEKINAEAALISTEKQHRHKVQEMVQTYAESTSRIQHLESTTRKVSAEKLTALRAEHSEALSTLKSAHALEMQDLRSAHADEKSKSAEKVRSQQLRGVIRQMLHKTIYQGFITWKLAYLKDQLSSNYNLRTQMIAAKHQSESKEAVESHKVTNTRALLEKERIISNQQILLETRMHEMELLKSEHRRTLIKASLMRFGRAQITRGWNSWRLVLADSRFKGRVSKELAIVGTQVSNLEEERTQLKSAHDALDLHRKKLISQHSSLQREFKVLASDKEISESGHKAEMAELRQQLESLILERSELSGGLTNLRSKSEESVAGLEGKMAAMKIELEKLASEKTTAQQQREELYKHMTSLENGFAANRTEADMQISNLQTAVRTLEKQRQELLEQSSSMNAELLNLRSEAELVRSKYESELDSAQERYDALRSVQEQSKESLKHETNSWKEQRGRLLTSHEEEIAKLRKTHAAVSETLAAEIAGLRTELSNKAHVGIENQQVGNRFAPSSEFSSIDAVNEDRGTRRRNTNWARNDEVLEPSSHFENDIPSSSESKASSMTRTTKLPMFTEDHMEAVEMPDSPHSFAPELTRGIPIPVQKISTKDANEVKHALPATSSDPMISVYDALVAAERVVGAIPAAKRGSDDYEAVNEIKADQLEPQGATYRVLFPTGDEPLGIEIDSQQDSLPTVKMNTTGKSLPRIGDVIVGVGNTSLIGCVNPQVRLAELVGMDSKNSAPDHQLVLEFRRTEAGTAAEKQAWLDSLPSTEDESACQDLRRLLSKADALKSWSGPVALWEGITFDEATSRVTTVKLDGWGVKAALSSVISALRRFPSLNELVLDNNPKISGSTNALQELPRLRDLSLDACVGLIGDIMPIGRALTNLTSLDLTNCTKITGDLRSIISLSGLRLLCLGDTQLSGNLTSLRSMVQLRHLDLHKVTVNGNINILSGLRHLETATITSNRVIGRLGNIANLTNLKVLTLSGTRIEGNLTAVCKFTKLVKLELANCAKIEGSLRDTQRLTNLEEISLQGSSVRGNLSELEPCKKLSHINLKSCKHITGSLQEVGNFPCLHLINIAMTRIRCSQKEQQALAIAMKKRDVEKAPPDIIMM